MHTRSQPAAFSRGSALALFPFKAFLPAIRPRCHRNAAVREGSSKALCLSGLTGAAIVLLLAPLELQKQRLSARALGSALGVQPHQPHTLCFLHFQELHSFWYRSWLKAGWWLGIWDRARLWVLKPSQEFSPRERWCHPVSLFAETYILPLWIPPLTRNCICNLYPAINICSGSFWVLSQVVDIPNTPA